MTDPTEVRVQGGGTTRVVVASTQETIVTPSRSGSVAQLSVIQGPMGPQGSQGPQGVQGVKGDTGAGLIPDGPGTFKLDGTDLEVYNADGTRGVDVQDFQVTTFDAESRSAKLNPTDGVEVRDVPGSGRLTQLYNNGLYVQGHAGDRQIIMLQATDEAGALEGWPRLEIDMDGTIKTGDGTAEPTPTAGDPTPIVVVDETLAGPTTVPFHAGGPPYDFLIPNIVIPGRTDWTMIELDAEVRLQGGVAHAEPVQVRLFLDTANNTYESITTEVAIVPADGSWGTIHRGLPGQPPVPERPDLLNGFIGPEGTPLGVWPFRLDGEATVGLEFRNIRVRATHDEFPHPKLTVYRWNYQDAQLPAPQHTLRAVQPGDDPDLQKQDAYYGFDGVYVENYRSDQGRGHDAQLNPGKLWISRDGTFFLDPFIQLRRVDDGFGYNVFQVDGDGTIKTGNGTAEPTPLVGNAGGLINFPTNTAFGVARTPASPGRGNFLAAQGDGPFQIYSIQGNATASSSTGEQVTILIPPGETYSVTGATSVNVQETPIG
jgi:hypothetical protein